MDLIKELKKLEQNYRKAHMDFVEGWANFVRTYPDEKWSKQQNVLINSFLMNAKQLSPKEYLELKGEKCSR